MPLCDRGTAQKKSDQLTSVAGAVRRSRPVFSGKKKGGGLASQRWTTVVQRASTPTGSPSVIAVAPKHYCRIIQALLSMVALSQLEFQVLVP